MRKLLILAALSLAAGQAFSSPAPWGRKNYGLLLVSAAEGGDFNKLVAEVKKTLGPSIPVEAAAGSYGSREIKKAVDSLNAQKAGKIVVVPLYLHSDSPDLAQLKYLLGIEEYPSRLYVEGWRMGSRIIARAKSKVPIVLTGALDESRVVSDILADRAKPLSRKAPEETLVLIGAGSTDDQANSKIAAGLEKIGRRLLRSGKFRSVETAVLRQATKERPKLAEESDKSLRELVRAKSKESRVIVLPYQLAKDGSERDIPKKLNNLFYRWKGDALMPDERLAKWTVSEAALAARGPDMVKFKDAGKELPRPERKKRLK